MGHGWERDEIERLFCFASEASACCVEEGPRAQLGRGVFFWRAKRASVALKKGRGLGWASEASLCCFEEGLRVNLGRGDFFWRAKRASVALGSSHARAAQTHGPGVRSKILCSGEAGQRTNMNFCDQGANVLYWVWPFCAYGQHSMGGSSAPSRRGA